MLEGCPTKFIVFSTCLATGKEIIISTTCPYANIMDEAIFPKSVPIKAFSTRASGVEVPRSGRFVAVDRNVRTISGVGKILSGYDIDGDRLFVAAVNDDFNAVSDANDSIAITIVVTRRNAEIFGTAVILVCKSCNWVNALMRCVWPEIE